MKQIRVFLYLICVLFILCLSGCMVEIPLPGNLRGTVTDDYYHEPIKDAEVDLNLNNATVKTTNTSDDGVFLFAKIDKGIYEIQASKQSYESVTATVTVEEAKTAEIDLQLPLIPFIEISDDTVDFGLESTVQFFTVSNAGSGRLGYVLLPNQDWIKVNPVQGDVTTETDTIAVSIIKTGFTDEIHRGEITITSDAGGKIHQDQVDVFVNGLMDEDGNYYRVVRIGSQVWMGENLNTGKMVTYGTGMVASDNRIAEKYCYNNVESNCDIYGGLYAMHEMMDYGPADTGTIGTTQGICPAGWHIPTGDEWSTLEEFVGQAFASQRLREAGTEHWDPPNNGTDEFGFTALPGGGLGVNNVDQLESGGLGNSANFWIAPREYGEQVNGQNLILWLSYAIYWNSSRNTSCFSVRCIKDP